MNETTEALSPELEEKRRELAEKRKAYEAKAAQNAKESVTDRTVEEVAADVEKELKKAARHAKKNEPKILEAFPLLSSSPFADEASKCIYWSEEHESIAIVCRDENGVGKYTKVREKYIWDKDAKALTSERQGGKWIKTWGAPAYPFSLPLFWAVFDFHKHYIITEGEKDAINVNLCGLPAITMGSTSDASKWGEYIEKLPEGATPIIWTDNDDAGRKAAAKIKEIFEAKGITPLVVKWELLDPKAKNKEDATDHIAKHGSDGIEGRLIKACGFVPKTKEWRQITAELLPKVRPLKSKNFEEVAIALDKYATEIGDTDYSYFQIEAAKLFARLSDEELEHFNGYDEMDDEGKAVAKEKLEKKYKKQLQMKLVYDFFGRSAMVSFIKHSEADAVKEILELFENNGIALFRKYKLFHYYSGTHFQAIEPEAYQNFILDFIDAARVNPKQAYQKKFILEVNGGVMERIRHSVSSGIEDKGIINHQGGTIFIDADGTLTHKEHNPEDGITYCLPFAYDSAAKCDMWMKFLTTSLVTVDETGKEIPDWDSIFILQEYVAYCFLPRYVDYFPYLYGLGANGKSVFLSVIEALFDESAVSRLNLVNMKDHQLDALSGKLINIASEIPSGAYLTEQIATLKSMVVGEPIPINPKNRDPYVLRRPPKMLMAGNEELKGGGTDDGLRRRIITIAFDKQIPVEQRIDNLHGKIIENELPGILNWVLEGLERFVKNNYKFTQSKKSEEAKRDYRRRTDHVWAFIEDNFVMGSDGKPTRHEQTRISTSALYTLYKSWAEKEGVKALAQKNFTTTLGMETHLNQKVKQLSAKERYFVGFRILEDKSDPNAITEEFNMVNINI